MAERRTRIAFHGCDGAQTNQPHPQPPRNRTVDIVGGRDEAAAERKPALEHLSLSR